MSIIHMGNIALLLSTLCMHFHDDVLPNPELQEEKMDQTASTVTIQPDLLKIGVTADQPQTATSRLKTILKQSPLTRLARPQYENLYCIGRKLTGIDKRKISQYLTRHEIKKLHLGCGYHPIAGWLNSDLFPQSKDVVVVNATKKFSFPSETFDYIFSEHMIEHLSYQDGQRMLQECYRVIKPGGSIRVSTPDLSFLISLYSNSRTHLQDSYIRWATDEFLDDVPAYCDTFVINNFFRDWGHTFIYDEKTLRLALKLAGFSGILRCNLNESENEEFRGLENDSRMPSGFMQLETLTLEATKAQNR